MSSHNGHVERLHRTLLDKVRTMRLACNAPASLWDEFCTTAAYLMSLTATSSLNGKTPFELWFGHPPSLLHLCEIGCRAFTLVLTHNPKLLQRSVPCVLIGYAPHAKAYRLWNLATGRVFNSYHVTFIEHLDTLPADLLPGTLVNVDDGGLPPSWDAIASICTTPSFNPMLPPSDLNNPIPLSIIPSTIIPNSSVQLPTLPELSHDTITTPPNLPTNIPNTSTSILNSLVPSGPTIPSELPVDSSSSLPPSIIVTPPSPPRAPPSPPHVQPLAPPQLCHSPCNPVPFSCEDSRDGLLPDTHLSGTLSDVRASALCRQEECTTRRTAQSDDHTHAFLAEFAPLRQTHLLLAVDLDQNPLFSSLSIDDVLSALSDGTIKPTLDSGDEPSWAQALASPERKYWIAGGHDELKSLEDLKVFILVPHSEIPCGQCPLKGKLVCKQKRDDMGNVVHYKVRYMVKGYAQCYGIDYDKTTAPTVHLESFRVLLHIAASLGWDVQHFDIKTAFLHGILPENKTMFMEQLPGFEVPGKEDWVMKLMKSIYRMKQASRVWNWTFDRAVRGWGFNWLLSEWCIYWRQTSTGTVIFAVHVDNIISIAPKPSMNKAFKSQLKDKWDITDLGPAKFVLGIAISCNPSTNTISISQTALIDWVVKQFNQHDAHPVDVPMVARLQLHRPDKKDPVTPEIAAWAECTPYRSLVSSLMYIAVST